MRNERLQDALVARGITLEELAKKVSVNPKTVERWITQARTPYPRFRHKVAATLNESERYLWPKAVSGDGSTHASRSEVVQIYPHRSDVPGDLWAKLFEKATTYVDILVYVGMFMTEKPDLRQILTEKAENGARIRLLYGNKYCSAVKQRSVEEGIGEDTVSAKIDHALAHVRPLLCVNGIQVRTHQTVLYNSIYRFDDEMIVNPHVYGKIAAHAPAIHLKRLAAGELFTTYADSFDAVWDKAQSCDWGDGSDAEA